MVIIAEQLVSESIQKIKGENKAREHIKSPDNKILP